MKKQIKKISDLEIGQEYFIAFGKHYIKKMWLIAIINEEPDRTELYVENKHGSNLLYFIEIGVGTTRQEARENYGRFNYEYNTQFANSIKDL